MKPRVLLVLVAAALAALGLTGAITPSSANSSGLTNPKHFFWARGQSDPDPGALTNDIIYHGGNAGDGAIGVETNPSAYLVFWGKEWADGFTTTDTDGTQYSSKTLQKYLRNFMANLGGSPWADVQTQYCRNVPAGSTSCAGVDGAEYITNPLNQLKGIWTDPTVVPDDIVASGLAENLVDDPIAMEAQRASAHFNNPDPNADYIIMVPPRPVATGEPAYCGYHTQTTSLAGHGNPYRIQYAFIPWQNTDWPGLGQGCGLHAVNQKSNAFGNGIFDSWSIVVGHEYSEAVTDPDNFFAVQDGWNDDQTSENADKCAWIELQNIKLGRHQFAIQPTWSNEAFDAGKDGCAVSR
jgi:hypothetical protein